MGVSDRNDSVRVNEMQERKGRVHVLTLGSGKGLGMSPWLSLGGTVGWEAGCCSEVGGTCRQTLF